MIKAEGDVVREKHHVKAGMERLSGFPGRVHARNGNDSEVGVRDYSEGTLQADGPVLRLFLDQALSFGQKLHCPAHGGVQDFFRASVERNNQVIG